ncbi:MAG: DUF2318 domain-containing protein [Thermoplasmata archaeon]|nr:MAG: DUF2318 domain-containing protein [Thermoplasmata archaeon]
MSNINDSMRGRIATGIVLTIVLLMTAVFAGCTSDNGSEKGGFEEAEDQPDIVEVPDEGDGDGSGGNDDNGTSEEPEPVTALQIPTAETTTDAKWYPYDSDGVEIRFFAVRSNDGEIHVAFDACDVCYAEKKGYRQEGIQMTCNNCGQSFPIKAIGSENLKGGCWPSYLPVTIEDDYIIIMISDLEEKRYMFE